MKQRKKSMIQVQAHRGSPSVYKENTLPSFLHAIESGVHFIEMDLHLTSDYEVVIHHDFHLRDSKKLIKETLREKLHQDIPTLQELFEWIQNCSLPQAKEVHFNLEIKRESENPEYSHDVNLLVEKIIQLVQAFHMQDRVLYTSFDPEVLRRVKEIEPNAKIGFIHESSVEVLVERALELKAEVLSLDHRLIENRETIEKLKKHGFKVYPWTVNEPSRWQELIDYGVDGLITDYPKELIAYLNHG